MLTLQQNDAYYASTSNDTATSDQLLAASQLLSSASLQQSNHTTSTMHSLPQHTLMGLAPMLSLAVATSQPLPAVPGPLAPPFAAPAEGGAGVVATAAVAGAGKIGVLPSQALQAYPGGLSKQAAQAVQARIAAAAAAFEAEGPVGQAAAAAPSAQAAAQKAARAEALLLSQGASVATAGAGLAPAQQRVEPLTLLDPGSSATLSPVAGSVAGASKPRPAPCKVFILVRLRPLRTSSSPTQWQSLLQVY